MKFTYDIIENTYNYYVILNPINNDYYLPKEINPIKLKSFNIIEDNNFYIFENSKNKYSKNKFTKSQAIKFELTNKGSTQCINCQNCINSHNCISCNNLENCRYCKYSFNLLNRAFVNSNITY